MTDTRSADRAVEPQGALVSANDTEVHGTAAEEEHFTPRGTIFVLTVYVATIVLLWASVYVILLSRGVTT